ncbi:MAG TPA: hypothetical protein VJP40_04445 [bacterium]|nr:hypothetical protein [bacterium]
MIKIGKIHWLGLILLALAACGSVPNKGIEVGNPDLKGKVLTLTPKNLPETFLVDFEEDGDVVATRVLENQFENVPATLESEENQSRITATFADATLFEVILSFDEAGTIVETSLFLNGQEVELAETNLTTKATQRPDFEQAALGVAGELCTRLFQCGVEPSEAACTESLLDLPGLAPSLGGTGAQTIREMQAALEAGTLETDPASLETCFWEISQMPCPQVQQAGPASDPQASQNIRKMIPRPSCASGFRSQ